AQSGAGDERRRHFPTGEPQDALSGAVRVRRGMNRHDSDEIDAVLTASYDVKRSTVSGRELDWEPHWTTIVCAPLKLLLFASNFEDLMAQTKKVGFPSVGSVDTAAHEV